MGTYTKHRTITIESKMNFKPQIKRAIEGLEGLPPALKTLQVERMIISLEKDLEKIDPSVDYFQPKGKIIVLNTKSGASEVLDEGSKVYCERRFKKLEDSNELQEDPALFKVALLVNESPGGGWEPANQKFTSSWNG